jgi:DNA transformation protein
MASDPGFVEHVLDLVGLVAPVEARRMFGGHGVFAHGVMFGLLDDGELFLKTDEESRPRFVEAGCRRWTFVTKKVRMEETSYFRPPDEAHEGPDAMLPWARLALDAALRLRAARVAETTRKAAANAPGRARKLPRKASKGARPAKAARPAPRSRSGKPQPKGPARRRKR